LSNRQIGEKASEFAPECPKSRQVSSVLGKKQVKSQQISKISFKQPLNWVCRKKTSSGYPKPRRKCPGLDISQENPLRISNARPARPDFPFAQLAFHPSPAGLLVEPSDLTYCKKSP
jgi:hypothetical protein